MAAQAAIHDFLFVPGAIKKIDLDDGLRRYDGRPLKESVSKCVSITLYVVFSKTL